MDIVDILNRYGFATLAAIGLGWFVYFIYLYITTQIKVKLGEMNGVLIMLIDRIRMLDNDLIRLNAKLDMILQERERHGEIKTFTDTTNADDNKSSK